MFCGPLAPQEAFREVIWEMFHTLSSSWVFWVSLSIQNVRRIPAIKILIDFVSISISQIYTTMELLCVYPLVADLHFKKSFWKICVKSGTLEYRAHNFDFVF